MRIGYKHSAKTLAKMRQDPIKRFWSKVDKNGPIAPALGTHCWEWTASLHADGYGQFRMGQQVKRSHHISWHWSGKPLPKDEYLLHHCDNRKCVRPDHLFLGTAKDNTQDMLKKKRHHMQQPNWREKTWAKRLGTNQPKVHYTQTPEWREKQRKRAE